MRIFISAGEASGDAYAAALVREIRKLAGSRITISAVGGAGLREEGVGLAADSSTWGAISIVQSLKVAPRALAGYAAARREIKRGSPGLFIPIDFGFFNIRLARLAKGLGWKVLYFVPPGSWRRDRQGRDLPAITDAVVTPFPWSAELLRKAGVNVHFFGHPLKQLVSGTLDTTIRGERVAVLPGSRRHEIDANLPMVARATSVLTDVRFEFALAPSANRSEIQQAWEEQTGRRQDVFTQNDTYGALARARAAIVCSGTATLEAALLRCPMVVVYRVSKSMAREAKLVGFKMPEFISLPNICLARRAVPETVALDISPEELGGQLRSIFAEGDEREAQLDAFEELADLLGPDDAISRTAELALSMLTR